MRRLAIRRRTDVGTILLHWLVAITLTTLIATGLRIAADEPEHAWLLVFDRLLPKRVVWTGHLPAALVQDRFGLPVEPTPAQTEGLSAYRGGFIADPRAAKVYETNFETQPLPVRFRS
jgi:hypothetical protein